MEKEKPKEKIEEEKVVAKPMEPVKKPEKIKCTDPKCPKHGNVSTHGYKFKGTIVSDKMQKSAIVECEFVRKISKYMRYEKQTTRVTVHNPACINAKFGDKVVVQECRPLSKTKSFVIIEKLGEK